jgi:hypothetical protein
MIDSRKLRAHQRIILTLLSIPLLILTLVQAPKPTTTTTRSDGSPITRVMPDVTRAVPTQTQPTPPAPAQNPFEPFRQMWTDAWGTVGRRKKESAHPATLKKPRRMKLKGMGGKC